jgi:YidC/Oxa1 family membrane protein insertase
MEKKAILALVLALVVLAVWTFFSEWKKAGRPVEEEKQAWRKGLLSETGGIAFLQPHTVEERTKSDFPVESDEKEIHIETPLYEAIFSNTDSVIRSFKLKEYRSGMDPQSPWVDLVDSKLSEKHLLRIDFQPKSSSEEERLTYHVQDASLELLQKSSPQDLSLSAMTSEGVYVTRKFRFYPEKYSFDLIVTLYNSGGESVEGNLIASLGNFVPRKRKRERAFKGAALLVDGKMEKLEPRKLIRKREMSGQIDWVAFENRHFMTAMVPGFHAVGTFEGRWLPSGIIRAAYVPPPIRLKPHEQVMLGFSLYMGPRDLGVLKKEGKNLDKAIHFGWADVIAKPCLYALRFLERYTGNYGLAIILLSVLIKVLFWPVTRRSYQSMKAMQKLQPSMAKIKARYKDDREKMNEELMRLYRRYGVNPMGGCLPLLIQVPIFFALFKVLSEAIELRHAPFMLWVTDLSAPDRLLNFDFKIPFMAAPYGIPALTLLMGASMFVQQRMMPTPGDPRQEKAMMILPAVFTVFFMNFPSGLVLYWLVNTVLSIGQQYRVLRTPD